MRRRLLLLVAGLAVIFVGANWLAGREESGPPSPLLQALRSDPMARYVPPRGRLTVTREQDQGSALGKAFLLEYARDFSVAREDADGAAAAAAGAAKRAGWRFSARPSQTPDEYYGIQARKTVLDGQSATLTIVWSLPPGAKPSAPRLFQVSMTAR